VDEVGPRRIARWLGRLVIAICLAAAGLVALLVSQRLRTPRAASPQTLSEDHLASLARVYPQWSADELERLQVESWLRPYAYEPFTGFTERPFQGRYVHVDEAGFRWSRDQCPWPPDPSARNLFFFGGSTLFGYGVTDADTIVSKVREALKEPGREAPCVYNFGRGWYYSTQERILFERLLVAGRRPQMAVFVDGLNEFFFPEDEPRFTTQLRRFVREINAYLEPRASSSRGGLPSPRVEATATPGTASPTEQRDGVVRRYLQHLRLTRAIGDAFGVRTLFVWQAVPVYGFDLARHPFRTRVDGTAWAPLVRAGYESMAARRGKEPRPDLVWCADVQEAEGGPLYVDGVHYSPEMCGRMARCIAAGIRESLASRAAVADRDDAKVGGGAPRRDGRGRARPSIDKSKNDGGGPSS
jgi:hypothetical protein